MKRLIRKILSFFALFCMSLATTFAQDIITLKNGDEIKAVVQEIGYNEITYKLFDNLQGQNYTLKKSEVFRIVYANGYKEVFSVTNENYDNQKQEDYESCYSTYLEKGNIFFDNGQYDYAKIEYLRALQCSNVPINNNLEKLIENAETAINGRNTADNYYNKKEYINAKQEYEKLIMINPKDNYAKESIVTCNKMITKQETIRKLNGHYISLGIGEYYGTLGLSYEYRYKIIGGNVSFAGYFGNNIRRISPTIRKSSGDFSLIDTREFNGIGVNLGFKIYLSNNAKFFKNFYFNFIPFAYSLLYFNTYLSSYDYPIRKSYKQFDYGVVMGYSPIWYTNKKKVALGFNIDVGIRVNYPSRRGGDPSLYIDGDIGFVIKF